MWPFQGEEPRLPPMASAPRHGLEAAAAAEAPAVVSETKESKRSKMQDFSAFPLYLNNDLWSVIEDKKVDNTVILRKIVLMLATDFHLRNPSEATHACLTALLILREPDEAERNKLVFNGYAFLSSVKAQVSQILAPFRNRKPDASQVIERLPVEVAELPESLPIRASLALVRPRISVSELLMTAQSFNWREVKGKKMEMKASATTPTALDPALMMQGLVQLGQMMAGSLVSSSSDNVNFRMTQPKKSPLASLLDSYLLPGDNCG